MQTWFLFDEHDALLVIHDNDAAASHVATGDLHHVTADDYVCRVSSPDFEGYTFTPLRASYATLPHPLYLRAGKAWKLLYWGEQTVFCSVCGHPMRWNTSISRVCTHCGREIWPQLNTAIIVLVHRGDEALLVRAKTFRRHFFGLVAGFVETGESLEECVAREVKEETSLSITNLRYFASQPWPYPLGLMVGFHADYAGGDIRFADRELLEGRFFTREEIASIPIPEPLSMARMLIDDWLGKPKDASNLPS